MVKAKNQQGDGFGLSFLDVLCCGLGAAILLLLIVKHEEPFVSEDSLLLMAEPELERLDQQIEQERVGVAQLEQTLIRLRSNVKNLTLIEAETSEKRSNLEQELRDLTIELASEVAKIEELEALTRRLMDTQEIEPIESNSNGGLRFGAISGLQFGEEDKVAILLDRSASMIHRTLVEIVRTQSAGDEAVRSSYKWRQAKLVAQFAYSSIDRDKRFKFLTFSEDVFDLNGKVLGGGELFWDKKSGLHDSLIKGVDNITPKGGTNLHLAIEALSRLVPKPDRIVLITDGLPGKIANRARLKACPKKSTGVTRLDGECRISIAIKSVEKLGGKLAKVPVDIILLPLEGDSDAVRFYSLISGISAGKLISPSADWLLR